MTTPRDGVLLSAHGTVEDLDDLPGFLSRIRRGRPTPPDLIAEVRRRYEQIGGSPLLRITRDQASALSARLGLPVFVGMRLWGPSLESAIASARDAGVTRLLSLPLAPQSVEIYHQAAREAAATLSPQPAPELLFAPPWGNEPHLLDAFSALIDEALARFPEPDRASTPVVLSAHSLPTRVIASGDPYESQFRAMAEAVIARRHEPARPYRIAFQSQGMDGGSWLGPDLPATFADLAASGARDVVIAAIGFVSDHVETLYDLDLDAPELAKKAGLRRLERAASLNAHPGLIEALATVALGVFNSK